MGRLDVQAASLGLGDARFCELTDRANIAFQDEDDDEAWRLYERALVEAERLLDSARAGGSPLIAPMAYTIACHNAAEVKKKAGDHNAAYGFKRLAVETLLTIAESASEPLALRVNCVRHLNYALAFLAEDAGGGEALQAEIERIVARVQTIADELRRIAGHTIATGGIDGHRSDERGRLS